MYFCRRKKMSEMEKKNNVKEQIIAYLLLIKHRLALEDQLLRHLHGYSFAPHWYLDFGAKIRL